MLNVTTFVYLTQSIVDGQTGRVIVPAGTQGQITGIADDGTIWVRFQGYGTYITTKEALEESL